jgi:sulfur relay (sulfurtransferase) DsrC/TusE family protein
MALEYTFWLVPSEPLKSKLQNIVDALALEFDAPKFDPHVTLYWGPSNEVEARAAVAKTAAQFGPVKLEVETLEQSADFTKTFFIQFRISPYAQSMCEAMRKNFATPSSYILNPHLSLLYKHMPEDQRRKLCDRPLTPPGSYLFDSVAAVEFDGPWSGEYRVLAQHQLRGK